MLLEPQYHDATIYAAWEHLNIVNFAKILLSRFGNSTGVPEWDNSDYDTVFVFTIDWNEPRNLKFEVREEDLGPIEESCPSQECGSDPARSSVPSEPAGWGRRRE